jgi:hypothetical protein
MAIDQVDRTVVTQGPTVGQETVRTDNRRTTPRTVLFRGLFAFALVAASALITAAPASAAHTIAAATTCNNGVGGGGGKGVICEVTIVNTITESGGSAKVTVHECLGSAGAPLAGVCSTTTTSLSAPVSTVNQCNGTVEGGGSTLHCSVVVTNNFIGISPGATGATVNQCVGSVTTGTVKVCHPFPATTTDAAITQCNGSANGGGASLTCTATGTMASAFAVTINQCNNSASGGGSTVVCSANMVNGPGTGSTASPPPTTLASVPSSSGDSTPLLPILICFALGGLGLAIALAQRRTVRR